MELFPINTSDAIGNDDDADNNQLFQNSVILVGTKFNIRLCTMCSLYPVKKNVMYERFRNTTMFIATLPLSCSSLIHEMFPLMKVHIIDSLKPTKLFLT